LKEQFANCHLSARTMWRDDVEETFLLAKLPFRVKLKNFKSCLSRCLQQ